MELPRETGSEAKNSIRSEIKSEFRKEHHRIRIPGSIQTRVLLFHAFLLCCCLALVGISVGFPIAVAGTLGGVSCARKKYIRNFSHENKSFFS